MKLMLIWFVASCITYWHTMHSKFGKEVFQHNLRVEGEPRDIIVIFCILFAIGWPLWWFFMFPIGLRIGRKQPRSANPMCTRTRDELARFFRTNADGLWKEVEQLPEQYTAHAEHLRNKARYYDWAWKSLDQSLASLEQIHSARPEECKSCLVRRCIFKKIEDLLEVAKWPYPKNKRGDKDV